MPELAREFGVCKSTVCRTIQRAVEDALSEEIISNRISLGDMVRLTVQDGKIAFQREQALPPAEASPVTEQA